MQASDPCWVPPLLIDQQAFFDDKHPFYEHGSVRSLTARSSDSKELLGRVCAIHNRAHNEFSADRVGFFGFFECVNDPEVARALLETAASHLKDLGLDTIRGPMNFSTNEECGMLVDGFDAPPAIMMTHNPPYYNDLLQACGFSKAKDLLAYEMSQGEISARVSKIAEKLKARLDIRFRFFDKSRFWDEVEKFKTVYNEAWEDNWGFVPMTDREIDAMAKNLKLILDPALVIFAENSAGKCVGFSLGLPDLNVVLKKINGRLFPFGLVTLLTQKSSINRARILAMGVLPEYRKRGIDVAMYYEAYRSGLEAGYNWGEFSWVLEDNKLMNDAARTLGSRPYKTWRIWEKSIN